GVDAERLYMHVGDADQISATALVELIEIGFVLEEVGIQTAFGNLQVGLHVVGKDLDIELHAFTGQRGFDELEDLGVGNGSGGDAQFVCRMGTEGSGQGQNSKNLLHWKLRNRRGCRLSSCLFS